MSSLTATQQEINGNCTIKHNLLPHGNGYYQEPRYMLLSVVYDEGRFLHLLDVPGYDFRQPSMVIDLANPPDGPLERRATRRAARDKQPIGKSVL